MRLRFLILILFLPLCLPAAKDHPFRVRSVTFEGNASIDKAVLKKVMISRPSHFMVPNIFHEEIFLNDLDRLQAFYRRKGFLEASIPTYSIEVDSAKKYVHLKVQIFEGEQTFIDGISFIGNRNYPDSVLTQALKLKVLDPLDGAAIEKSQLILLRLYADNGFLDAQINPTWNLVPGAKYSNLDFNIKEGTQYKVGQIETRGLEKTRPNVVLREVTFETDEIVSFSKILESQRNLYLTGLFESVFIDPLGDSTESNNSTQKMVISVNENQAGSINISVGYGAVERGRLKTEFTQNNLYGTAMKIAISGRISALYRVAEVAFTNPRIYDSQWRMDTKLRYDLQFQPTYRLKSYGWSFAAQRNLVENLTTTLTLRNELNEISHVKLDSLEGASAADVHSIQLRISRDTRDNLFSPSKGSLLECENEFAFGPQSSSNSFYRSVFKYRTFKTVFSEVVLGSAIEVGFITSYDGNLTISLQERFYTGGPNSLRGYGHREVGPQDSNQRPRGGFYEFIWHVFELRVPVYKGLEVAGFADVGNIWWDYRDIPKGKYAADLGIGLNYNSPLGVLRLDFALPVGNIPEQKSFRVNFSLGYAF